MTDLATDEDDRRDHVIHLVNQINTVLCGEIEAEVQTALVIAVACEIVAATEDKDRVMQMIAGFTMQLQIFVQREDFVEWIKNSIVHSVTPGTKRSQ